MVYVVILLIGLKVISQTKNNTQHMTMLPPHIVPLHAACLKAQLLVHYYFFIYINDIVHNSNKLKFWLYADDTTLLIQGHNINDTLQVVITELKKVHKWILSNKLTLNHNKTHYIISSPLMTRQINIYSC